MILTFVGLRMPIGRIPATRLKACEYPQRKLYKKTHLVILTADALTALKISSPHGLSLMDWTLSQQSPSVTSMLVLLITNSVNTISTYLRS